MVGRSFRGAPARSQGRRTTGGRIDSTSEKPRFIFKCWKLHVFYERRAPWPLAAATDSLGGVGIPAARAGRKLYPAVAATVVDGVLGRGKAGVREGAHRDGHAA